ncbi:bifunctional isochorismate lyase/aryl carrier protein [Nocardia transvalensis]|uniref:Bifunctional isochorismate lyase/aryl carrier protein n=1 Tax=Nocardia transvalensis TaxID=37333 RepID=A0A7W9PKR4_9NOCA|nr:isochorismatase family protein [Nocardia transvalensis]MBB5917429.1 bifunctional isochorismate lyase/aryl carrier protein [Nocardia transvalensis]
MGVPTIRPYPLPGHDEIPANTVEWRLEPERCALLIHDMQRYFLAPFADADLRSTLVERIESVRKQCQAQGIPVIFTAQPQLQSRTERGLLFDFWGAGPDRHTDIPEGLDIEGAVVLTKRRYSAFHGTRLLEILRADGREQLLVCGVYAHIGCLATVLDAFMNDIQPFAIADAMGDFSLDHHLFALRHIATRCGVVTTAGEVGLALEPAA